MGEDGSLSPFVSEAPWPVQLGDLWPPYLCVNCWAMRFYYNQNMAQCFYCGFILLNWRAEP